MKDGTWIEFPLNSDQSRTLPPTQIWCVIGNRNISDLFHDEALLSSTAHVCLHDSSEENLSNLFLPTKDSSWIYDCHLPSLWHCFFIKLPCRRLTPEFCWSHVTFEYRPVWTANYIGDGRAYSSRYSLTKSNAPSQWDVISWQYAFACRNPRWAKVQRRKYQRGDAEEGACYSHTCQSAGYSGFSWLWYATCLKVSFWLG